MNMNISQFFPSLRDLLNMPMEGGLRVRFAAPLVIRKKVGAEEPGFVHWAPFGHKKIPLGNNKEQNVMVIKGDSSSEEEKDKKEESSDVPMGYTHMSAVVPKMGFYKEVI